MENLLDKLFRNKLSNRNLDFDPAAWEDMEALLDGRPGKVKPQPLIKPSKSTYISLSLVLLMILSCAVLIYRQANESSSLDPVNYPIADATEEGPTDSSESLNEQPIFDSEKEMKHRLVDPNNTQKTQQSAFDIGNVYKESNIENPNKSNAESMDGSVARQKEQTKYLEKSNSKKSVDEIINEIGSVEENLNKSSRISSPSANTNTEQGDLTLLNSESTLNKTQQIELSYLLGLEKALAELKLEESKFSKKPIFQTIQQKQTEWRRPLFGIYVSTHQSPGDFKLGGGLFKEFPIGRKMTLSLEPGYAYTDLATVSIASESSTYFSFGVSDYTQDISTEAVHTVQLPVMAQFHWANSSFSGGVSYQYIVALQAQRNITIDGEISEAATIWLDKSFYRSSSLHARMAYNYNIGQSLGLGLLYELPLLGTNGFNADGSIGLILKLSI